MAVSVTPKITGGGRKGRRPPNARGGTRKRSATARWHSAALRNRQVVFLLAAALVVRLSTQRVMRVRHPQRAAGRSGPSGARTSTTTLWAAVR